MSEKLRECPLCNKNIAQIDHYDGIYYVLCNAKHGGCGTTSGGYENEEEAIGLWNTRHTSTHETVEQWEERMMTKVESVCMSIRHDYGLLCLNQQNHERFLAKEYIHAIAKEIE